MPAVDPRIFQALMGQQPVSQYPIPPMRRIPNNFDQMVVPPFGLPLDKNTYDPQDLMNYLNMYGRQEQS